MTLLWIAAVLGLFAAAVAIGRRRKPPRPDPPRPDPPFVYRLPPGNPMPSVRDMRYESARLSTEQLKLCHNLDCPGFRRHRCHNLDCREHYARGKDHG